MGVRGRRYCTRRCDIRPHLPRYGESRAPRKIVIVTSLVVSAVCVALAGRVATLPLAVALMAVTVFFMNLTLGAYWGTILDTVPHTRMGSVGGSCI